MRTTTSDCIDDELMCGIAKYKVIKKNTKKNCVVAYVTQYVIKKYDKLKYEYVI